MAGLAAVLTLATVSTSASAASPPSWSVTHPQVAEDVVRGQPLVVRVVVPLCDNAQIDCGSPALGNPRDLRGNLYWGALFGNRRLFDKDKRYTRIELRRDIPGVLERAVYRRKVAGPRWGRRDDVEQIVILDAVHGARINSAVKSFWSAATAGSTVTIRRGKAARRLTVHAVGYAGHNRLMDGIQLPAVKRPRGKRKPAASFVLACFSDGYFAAPLKKAGSDPLVTTTSFIAPEGYVTLAMTTALGDNRPRAAIRKAVVGAYAKYQRISTKQAGRYFAPALR